MHVSSPNTFSMPTMNTENRHFQGLPFESLRLKLRTERIIYHHLHQVIRLSLGSQPAAILLVEQHATTVVSHENGVGNHPEEVIGIVRTQAHQFENVVHSLWGNLGVEPKLNISILCLHESKNNAPPLNTQTNKQTISTQIQHCHPFLCYAGPQRSAN